MLKPYISTKYPDESPISDNLITNQKYLYKQLLSKKSVEKEQAEGLTYRRSKSRDIG